MDDFAKTKLELRDNQIGWSCEASADLGYISRHASVMK